MSDNKGLPVGFMGKKFDDMTKDEVLRAFYWAYNQIEQEKQEKVRYREMYTQQLFKR